MMIAPIRSDPLVGAPYTRASGFGPREGAPVVLRVARFSVKAGAGMDAFSVVLTSVRSSARAMVDAASAASPAGRWTTRTNTASSSPRRWGDRSRCRTLERTAVFHFGQQRRHLAVHPLLPSFGAVPGALSHPSGWTILTVDHVQKEWER
jgi:hypothetical protein